MLARRSAVLAEIHNDPEAQKRFNELVRNGETGTIKVQGKTYVLRRSGLKTSLPHAGGDGAPPRTRQR